MSADMVDDLHAAEDRVVQLEGFIGRLCDVLAIAEYPPELDPLVDEAREIVLATYCRASCADEPGPLHDEFCGCPCHSERE